MLRSEAQGTKTDHPVPINAITSHLDAFVRTPLVALGKDTASRKSPGFVVALLHHPRFAETVQVIMVEFGNA